MADSSATQPIAFDPVEPDRIEHPEHAEQSDRVRPTGMPPRTDRAINPVIKVLDLAWLEFTKRNLDAAEDFAHDFGFLTAHRSDDALYLRGALPGGSCVIIRQGPQASFVGPAFLAADRSDLDRLARATGATVGRNEGFGGGWTVPLRDPSGAPVQVAASVEALPAVTRQLPLPLNAGDHVGRVNRTQRPPREPARIERLGHVVLERSRFERTLDWYLHHLGLIVSDFLYFPGQRERGPTMAFIRCDRGDIPTDHHTLAMTLGPVNRYVHSAFQVAGLDALAAGGQFLAQRGYKRSWGIGRHIQGSQIFDYWRDPDGVLMEHFTDGDLFDSSMTAGWTEMTASGLAQWGPRATRDFLGVPPKPGFVKELMTSLRARDNDFDANRLMGLLKVASK